MKKKNTFKKENKNNRKLFYPKGTYSTQRKSVKCLMTSKQGFL